MTIDTSREVVERLAAEYRERVRMHDELTGACADLRRERTKDIRDLHEATADTLTALLAERDAALAEVARLSTPPDDAEVAAAHREWFATTYPHTYADVQSDYEALDAFVTSEEAWAAATRATLAKHGGK